MAPVLPFRTLSLPPTASKVVSHAATRTFIPFAVIPFDKDPRVPPFQWSEDHHDLLEVLDSYPASEQENLQTSPNRSIKDRLHCQEEHRYKRSEHRYEPKFPVCLRSGSPSPFHTITLSPGSRTVYFPIHLPHNCFSPSFLRYFRSEARQRFHPGGEGVGEAIARMIRSKHLHDARLPKHPKFPEGWEVPQLPITVSEIQKNRVQDSMTRVEQGTQKEQNPVSSDAEELVVDLPAVKAPPTLLRRVFAFPDQEHELEIQVTALTSKLRAQIEIEKAIRDIAEPTSDALQHFRDQNLPAGAEKFWLKEWKNVMAKREEVIEYQYCEIMKIGPFCTCTPSNSRRWVSSVRIRTAATGYDAVRDIWQTEVLATDKLTDEWLISIADIEKQQRQNRYMGVLRALGRGGEKLFFLAANALCVVFGVVFGGIVFMKSADWARGFNVPLHIKRALGRKGAGDGSEGDYPWF